MNDSSISNPALPDDQEETFETMHTSQSFRAGDQEARTLTRWRVDGTPADKPLAEEEAPTFHLIERIGRGGMGEVWEAVQTSLDRLVAVKFIAPDVVQRQANPEDRIRLRRVMEHEAVITARLEHPNIVPVHDRGTDEKGDPLIAMKRIHGRPWREMLREDFHLLSTPELLSKHLPILLNVCQAVAFAHSRGIIHRDIKPAQVMVGEFGEVLLVDWGLAIDLEDGPEDELTERRKIKVSTRETASSPSGTAVLMAPEQTEMTAEKLGRWTDIYLLSGTLYFMLTGKYPHQSGNSHAAFMKAMSGKVEDPRKRAEGRHVPDELAEICMKGLRMEPSERYASVEDFITAIQDYISGATRRRRAESIIQIVQEDLEQTPANYSELNAALARTEEATLLAPDHPELPRIRQRLHELYARAAISNHDLVLARIQAEALSIEAVRTDIVGEISTLEKDLQRQKRTARIGVFSAAALLTILFVSSAIFAFVFKGQRDQTSNALELSEKYASELEVQKDETERALNASRSRAVASQGLINFMMSDLASELSPSVKRDEELISKVSDKVAEHYRNLDTSQDPREIRIQHVNDLMEVALNLHRLSEYVVAAELYEQAITTLEELAPDSPNYPFAMMQAVPCYLNMMNLDRASELEEKARAIVEANFPENDPVRVLSLMRRGSLEMQFANWDLAEEMFLKAIKKAEEIEHNEYETHATSLLASLYQFQGRREESEVLYQKVVDLLVERDGSDSRFPALAMLNLADAYKDRGRLEEGRDLTLKAMAIIENEVGPNHPELVQALRHLGSYHYQMREFEEAKKYYYRAIDINIANRGEDYYYNSSNYQSLGVINITAGNWEEGEENIQKAIELRNREHGELSPYHVELLISLAAIYDKSGDFQAAEQTFLDVISILENHFDSSHPNNGIVRANLGYLYFRHSRYADAEPLLEAGLPIVEAAYGTDNVFTKGVREYKVQNYAWWGLESEGAVRDEKFQKAFEVWDEIGGIAINENVNQLMAVVFRHAGRDDEADRMLEYLVEKGILTQWVIDQSKEAGYEFSEEFLEEYAATLENENGEITSEE